MSANPVKVIQSLWLKTTLADLEGEIKQVIGLLHWYNQNGDLVAINYANVLETDRQLEEMSSTGVDRRTKRAFEDRKQDSDKRFRRAILQVPDLQLSQPAAEAKLIKLTAKRDRILQGR